MEVETEGGFTAGRPGLLFEAPYDFGYDVSPDGQQFLMVQSSETAETSPLIVVLNWFEELKERVPVP